MLEDNLNSENAAANTYQIASGNHGYVQETVAIDSVRDKITVDER